MFRYIINRILLLVPTLFGVILINFVLINLAPGGPIDQIKVQLNAEPSENMPSAGQKIIPIMDKEMIEALEKEFGFDQPLHKRFFQLTVQYLTFDFGESYFKGRPVIDLLKEAFPVSIFLTASAMFFILLISIPLGILKAVYQGSIFDTISTVIISLSFAIPSFIFATLFLIFLTKNNLFPLRGIVSENFDALSMFGKVKDFLWHLALPMAALIFGNLARQTLLTYNSFAQELGKLYTLTVRAKGATNAYILFKHCMKNAMLIIYANIPHMFMAMLFYTSLLVEVIFSIQGLGYLSYEATLSRDYPVMFALLYTYSLTFMLMHIAADIFYSFLDPRIDISQKRF